jgi:ABC-type transporter Mla subunit MlaD
LNRCAVRAKDFSQSWFAAWGLLSALGMDDGIIAVRPRIGGVFVEFQPMSPEDMQGTMQFLLRQQAQFAADSARVDAQLEALSGKVDQVASGLIGLTSIVDRVVDSVDRVVDSVGRVVDSVGRVVDGVSEIAEAQKRTDEQLRATDARLGEHIGRVEAHLNIVIEMFDRHLREDHGHRPS